MTSVADAGRALRAHRRAGELRRHPAQGGRVRDRAFCARARREPHRHDAHVRRGEGRSSPRPAARSSTPRRCTPSSAHRMRPPTPPRRAAWCSSRNRSPPPGRRTASASTPSRPGWIDTEMARGAMQDPVRAAPDRGAHADGALGRAGRRRRRGAFPSVRRGALRDRRRAAGRRGISDRLNAAALGARQLPPGSATRASASRRAAAASRRCSGDIRSGSSRSFMCGAPLRIALPAARDVRLEVDDAIGGDRIGDPLHQDLRLLLAENLVLHVGDRSRKR